MGFLADAPNNNSYYVVIVSGLPRSGTSMMMKMLEAGGMDVVQDHIREPNVDNPSGYYEYERVKKLPDGDTAWLADAVGKVVKVISQLVMHLPDTYKYKVLFVRRRMEEVLASQAKMLERRGEATDAVSDDKMSRLFEKHLQKVFAWMDERPYVTYLDVDYNEMLADPRPTLDQVNEFLDGSLDVSAMAEVIDPSLYRNRG
jgi:hypothetical protein